MSPSPVPPYGNARPELDREAMIGGQGTCITRDIPMIDLSDYDRRKPVITDALWDAATRVGFFQVINHGIDTADVDAAFAAAGRFFELPMEQKTHYARRPGSNVGWEYRAQVRPSTGTPDNKESYQITLPQMGADTWPAESTLPGFQARMRRFERQNWVLGMKILSCFAIRLGFDADFFTCNHDPASAQYQSTLRLIHYMSMENARDADFEFWRAGAHSDFDCLTLLHQRPGQGGLQVCPGRDADARGTDTLAWTDVPPVAGAVTCNIGDMLMRWSDDRLKSTLHRVRMPRRDEYLGPRLSLPFFCQANRDAVIQGPRKKYAPITARDYLDERIRANYGGRS
ncbi:2OG-Fe(II) oxygenase superfamily protein [Komagataeibacter europaeus]|uniref:2OG-Fe(II) oxygenase superfamily protein n=1 Tax=Komagataeibacter europaeus TaxID=33995 RepID=A0A0M0EI54_KOMEU|nr:2-oxoglutarate and iron-dependent oxygenase domain-containing protein [Komagataeibacter europaeus]KON64611.1 2OG-Fe(II) oxygenase superfamily protein [Komagataeibacter europaeus]